MQATFPMHAEDIADPSRSCGPCNRCCQGTLDGTIRGHVMGGGVPCHFLVDGGCSIYEERPEQPCRRFYCAWRLRRNPFPDEFRPDRLGVIILSMPWRDRVAWYLVPAGREPDAALLEWMRRHSSATGTPFLFKVNGRFRAYGSPQFQQDLVDRASRGEPLLPGLAAGLAGPVAMVPLTDDRTAAGG